MYPPHAERIHSMTQNRHDREVRREHACFGGYIPRLVIPMELTKQASDIPAYQVHTPLYMYGYFNVKSTLQEYTQSNLIEFAVRVRPISLKGVPTVPFAFLNQILLLPE